MNVAVAIQKGRLKSDDVGDGLKIFVWLRRLAGSGVVSYQFLEDAYRVCEALRNLVESSDSLPISHQIGRVRKIRILAPTVRSVWNW